MVRSRADTVRALFASWTDGDLPAMLEILHPEVVAQPLLGVLYTFTEARGHDGMRQWFRESRALGERFQLIVEDTRTAGDAVVAFLHVVVDEADSTYDARVAMVCEFRDGRIVSLRGRDVDEAVEDVDPAGEVPG
jgi:ketosteroid isomerase-like protein